MTSVHIRSEVSRSQARAAARAEARAVRTGTLPNKETSDVQLPDFSQTLENSHARMRTGTLPNKETSDVQLPDPSGTLENMTSNS